jgi:acyl-CoA thioester hydrolase
MSEFRFYHPIEVRYGDLDPQAHVNNAKFLTYVEQTRVEYLRNLGLWDGRSFMDIGIILAEARITFLAPVYYGQAVRVGARVSRIGNKSMVMDYLLEDTDSGTKLAEAAAIMVSYDYHNSKTIPVPDDWRQVIQEFEGLPRLD